MRRIVAALACAVALALCLTGCSSPEDEARNDAIDSIISTSNAAIQTYEDWYSGEIDKDMGIQMLTDYQNDLETLCGDAEELGVYSASYLYVDSIRINAENYTDLLVAGMDPDSMVDEQIEMLEQDLSNLESFR